MRVAGDMIATHELEASFSVPVAASSRLLAGAIDNPFSLVDCLPFELFLSSTRRSFQCITYDFIRLSDAAVATRSY